MYLAHFGLREPPFRITPTTEFFFAGAQRGAVLTALEWSVLHDEGLIRVVGEVGTGKTMLSRMLAERLPPSVLCVLIANPGLSPAALLDLLGHELGALPSPAGRLRALEERLIALHAEARRVVVLIDEAHAMPEDALEAVRLLSNLETSRHKLLQLVLFGQPELDALLSRPRLRPLRERITQTFRLQTMRSDEVADYVRFRLQAAGRREAAPFSPAALRLLAGAAGGLARRVNILADKALMAAFADDARQVERRHVRRALREADYPHPGPGWIRGFGALGLALGAAAAIGLGYVALTAPSLPTRQAASTAPPTPVSTAAAPTAVTAVAANPAAPPSSSPLPPELGPRARTLLQQSRQDLPLRPAEHWFLQLQSFPLTQAGALEAWLTHPPHGLDPAGLRLYLSAGAVPRLALIYGDYPDLTSARAALASLPAAAVQYAPYPRRQETLR